MLIDVQKVHMCLL